MSVDSRWIALVAVFMITFSLIRKRRELVQPLTTAVLITTLFATVLFFVTVPPIVLSD